MAFCLIGVYMKVGWCRSEDLADRRVHYYMEASAVSVNSPRSNTDDGLDNHSLSLDCKKRNLTSRVEEEEVRESRLVGSTDHDDVGNDGDGAESAHTAPYRDCCIDFRSPSSHDKDRPQATVNRARGVWK